MLSISHDKFGVSKDGKVKEINRLLIIQACNSLVDWIQFLHWDQVNAINFLENQCTRECYERGSKAFPWLLQGWEPSTYSKTREGRTGKWLSEGFKYCVCEWSAWMESSQTLCLATVIYVILDKSLYLGYAVCYSDKVRPYKYLSMHPHPPIFVGKRRTSMKTNNSQIWWLDPMKI